MAAGEYIEAKDANGVKQKMAVEEVDGAKQGLTKINTDQIQSLLTAIGGLLTELQKKADTNETQPVSGTFYQATQPVSMASVPSHEVSLPAATVSTLTPPAAITGFATAAKQDTLLTELQGKADLTETQPVSLASVPSHAVTTIDGGNVAQGATTDAAVVTDTTGTISGKLRGIVKLLLDKITVRLEEDADGANGTVKLKGWNSDENSWETIETFFGKVKVFSPDPLSVQVAASATVIGGVSDVSGDILLGTGNAASPLRSAISAATSGNNTIVAAVAGKKIRVLAMSLSFSGTVNAKFQSGASGTDKTGLFYGVANTQVVLPYNKLGWFETAAGALLNLNLSGAVAVGGVIDYIEV